MQESEKPKALLDPNQRRRGIFLLPNLLTTAAVIIIAPDSPSARSAMPSGGAQPPTM